jgi:hypothetical protein
MYWSFAPLCRHAVVIGILMQVAINGVLSPDTPTLAEKLGASLDTTNNNMILQQAHFKIITR